jgi:hypothetical protein
MRLKSLGPTGPSKYAIRYKQISEKMEACHEVSKFIQNWITIHLNRKHPGSLGNIKFTIAGPAITINNLPAII